MRKVGKFLLFAVLMGSQNLMAAGPKEEFFDLIRKTVIRQITSSPPNFLKPDMKHVIGGHSRHGVEATDARGLNCNMVSLRTLDTQGARLGLFVDSSSGRYMRSFSSFSGEKWDLYPMVPAQFLALYTFSRSIKGRLSKLSEREVNGDYKISWCFMRECVESIGFDENFSYSIEGLRDNFSQVHNRIFGPEGERLGSLIEENNRAIRIRFEMELGLPVPAVYHEFGYKMPQD